MAFLNETGVARLWYHIRAALGAKANSEDVENVAGEVENINESLIATNSEIGRLELLIVSKDDIPNEVEGTESFKEMQEQMTSTATDVNTIKYEDIPELEARVRTLESGVHITEAEMELHMEGTPYSNVSNADGWKVTENGTALIEAADGKVTAPKLRATDSMIIGGLAWKAGKDKHVRLLKYGR